MILANGVAFILCSRNETFTSHARHRSFFGEVYPTSCLYVYMPDKLSCTELGRRILSPYLSSKNGAVTL